MEAVGYLVQQYLQNFAMPSESFMPRYMYIQHICELLNGQYLELILKANKLKKYIFKIKGIIFISGGQYSWVARIVLVNGDVMSLVVYSTLIIFKQMIVYRSVGM